MLLFYSSFTYEKYTLVVNKESLYSYKRLPINCLIESY